MILTEIKARQIADYKVMRRQEGAAPRTVNYELSLMGHAFNMALREWEWVRENPVSKVRKEKVRNTIERWLTLEEEGKLVAASPKWLQEIIVFAIHTGFRESEILGLTWKQVDLNRRTITIYEQKNGNIDTLPISQNALRILGQRYENRHGQSQWVFLSKCGTRLCPHNLIRAFYEAIKRAGIERLRFHDLRHTFATRLVQNGVDLYTVQKLGRWKTTAMVTRYAHHYPESLRPGIETMDGVGGDFVTNLSHVIKKKGSQPLLRLVTP